MTQNKQQVANALHAEWCAWITGLLADGEEQDDGSVVLNNKKVKQLITASEKDLDKTNKAVRGMFTEGAERILEVVDQSGARVVYKGKKPRKSRLEEQDELNKVIR